MHFCLWPKAKDLVFTWVVLVVFLFDLCLFNSHHHATPDFLNILNYLLTYHSNSSLYLSITLSIYNSIYLSIYHSLYLFITLSFYHSIYLSITLSIYHSIYRCLPTYTNIYKPTLIYLPIPKSLQTQEPVLVMLVIEVIGPKQKYYLILLSLTFQQRNLISTSPAASLT